MSELTIEISGDRRSVTPGNALAGRVSWRVETDPESAEIRLFWYTRGKGTEDIQIIETLAFANPQASDRREFRLTLPAEPYSFSGKLISLIWALELILEPGSQVDRREFVMSANGREIQIAHERA